MIEQLDKQENIRSERDSHGRLLTGNTANPKGRPEGKTMKEFAREFLLKMDDEEKVKWLKSLGKDTVWRMAEGNPKQDTDIPSGSEVIKGFNYIKPNSK